ncbi:MAG: hypothetical protein U0997_09445 [Sulfurimicrobium sp.]|nr:hypothetical protein [Sulfurimicrobium sp.]
MKQWLKQCESWLSRQYQDVLGLELAGGPVRLRWLPADSLTNEAVTADAHGLVVEDADIGWLLFLLPYEPDRLEPQVNQALGLRSRLLRESNYTGNAKAGEKEDQDSTWRVGLVWLVEDSNWTVWQRHILELRRESGAAEEISFDAIKVTRSDVHTALDAHGLPRLLLHTRALLTQSVTEAEKWLSADNLVSTELENFSQQFNTSRTRAFARELEEKAKSIQPAESRQYSSKAREFLRFRVKHFRNLDSLEIVADRAEDTKAQAIVLFGPNGTGKSSFAEALSLAAFGTSPRLEQFLDDKDLARSTAQTYLNDYLMPLSLSNSSAAKPCFIWGKGEETPFALNTDEERKRLFEGVVLNQEDSINFSELPREKLAAQVLKGYSALADYISAWLAQEEKRANETKLNFTRKHGLSGAIKRSVTAYDRLAQLLLSEQLQRPSPEFLDWLRFLGRLSDEDGMHASKLVSAWTTQQANVVSRLAEAMAKFQEIGASQSYVAQAIREKLDEFDMLAKQSSDFRQRLESRIASLREQLDVSLNQLEIWGEWLVFQTTAPVASEPDSLQLKVEIENLAKERAELEETGKTLRGRLDLLDQAKQFLVNHWGAQHPDTCPVCNSDVAERQGIEMVVSMLQAETNATIQTLRDRHIVIQNMQKDLDSKRKVAGLSTCPLAAEDQARLKDWLQPFLPVDTALENFLLNPQHREQLKGDLLRMRVLPEAPKPYADTTLEAERLANNFIALTHEADKALEDPQSIGEVKKAFEQRLENVLKDHLPSTLGKVWQEITMSLTMASWLLPDQPKLKLEQRGKSLSVQTSESGRYVRYLYNAAERHVLGLAWFFTYYLAKKRFEEAWMLLDDPAQEMDQPSFRELVRLWETLLRIHQRKGRSLTMIVALHQEERALDATRATNGQLYILGWQKEQQDTNTQSSVKRVVLLAPGFHPLKPEKMFSE